jgi:hypothetical protein
MIHPVTASIVDKHNMYRIYINFVNVNLLRFLFCASLEILMRDWVNSEVTVVCTILHCDL